MNIFYLHQDAQTAAQAMTNKHVIKMILESAQLLSTAHHVLDGDLARDKDLLYKPTHRNHPSAVWVRQSGEHYLWLYKHFLYLCEEYTNRYGKTHATFTKLAYTLSHMPHNIPYVGFTQPPCAMPDQYKVVNDSVASYRNYYVAEKLKIDEDIARFNKFFVV